MFYLLIILYWKCISMKCLCQWTSSMKCLSMNIFLWNVLSMNIFLWNVCPWIMNKFPWKCSNIQIKSSELSLKCVPGINISMNLFNLTSCITSGWEMNWRAWVLISSMSTLEHKPCQMERYYIQWGRNLLGIIKTTANIKLWK